ncbi:branched-chain amino acid ABC transporter permease [Flavonifractor sp. DFI.6.63]|uniref:Branched-chain amino acid ABC transporter permease n=1 Tax=Lawsonibacter hominis TaxID=2763053 RepID=A0A8J6JDW2_9FIRM|nr:MULTISPECIES: branched-chain amino acid ABC transporter permease [Oscillospiraceae]MBS1384084.1 branched-chain amino acid ABC transporter permease [Flavonifractor sp.]MDU2194902.1 branched-chain amino acid ABC transporter permease [Clostridiales bacterium]MDY2976366.1 branched-chain amino acid ABC transporter permease [Oscillospiraceae bacterium]MBC5732555.1 branched-chain amino acid ABC transporter permease [Lawsonibacter hominis]MCI6398433.1 branched-chain amino acid ABC transporter perme
MQILINGILLGAIYALLGVGMSMMFGIVKLTNLAHGEFIIMGAFGSTILSSALGINPILTLVVTVPVMFLLGMVLQSVLINRVMLRGAEPALLVTFGLSIILKDAMLLLFTADAQKIGVSYATASLNLGGISISVLNLVVFAISLITILVLTLFLRKTYMGRAIRATSDDTVAASLMGVSVKKTYGVAMGIAMATAAIAGLCVGMRWTFYPSSGGEYLLIAFGVVVIGGMGSIPGTLVAGLVFGLAQVIGGANYGMFISYIVLLVMLAVRPQGLFSK